MFNFDFYNPTHILFGKDKLGEIGALVPTDARVLITYGGGSAKKSGLIDKARTALGDRYQVEFGGIEPNPRYETLMRAVDVARSERIDFLLAVGGGSVLDGTKFIALASRYSGDATDLLKHGLSMVPLEVAAAAIPLGTVLTLPATGSEMNCGAVISHENGKFAVLSPLVFPKFSVLDPTTTFSLPKVQVANGVVDAFVHTTEQYLTYPAGGLVQDRFAEGILKTLIEVGPKTVNTPEDYDARATHMWTATLALNGLIGAGVPQDWSTHMIGHELTAMFGIDHAQTLAIVLPSLLDKRREQKRAKLLQYAERVWGIGEGDENERIDQAIARTRDFFASLGIKTRLSQHGIEAGQIPAVIDQLRAHGMTALSETQDLTPEIVQEILTAAL